MQALLILHHRFYTLFCPEELQLRLAGQKLSALLFAIQILQALAAGFDHARGDIVVTMDADLQHPLEVIPVLLQKWKHGAEIVNTLRIDSAGTAFFKRVTNI